MMPWPILGIVTSFFFRVGTVSANGNGAIEHNSARELGRYFGGGVQSLVESLPSLEVELQSSKCPLTQAQEIILVCKLFYYLYNALMIDQCDLSDDTAVIILYLSMHPPSD